MVNKIKLEPRYYLADALHLRAILLKLSKGEKVTILPGSESEGALEHIVLYVDFFIQRFANHCGRARKTESTATKRGKSVRKSRRQQAAELRDLMKEYLEVHYSEDD